ncbi:DUF4176 domain-containing protein [Bacillus mycoides]|uniref:DUF4176 domain-containing protein n=1 Tax=Bacillus mycoides TaxID=1405 RepID=UPI00307D41B7
MEKVEKDTLLPIGSVVRFKTWEQPLMIYARKPLKNLRNIMFFVIPYLQSPKNEEKRDNHYNTKNIKI